MPRLQMAVLMVVAMVASAAASVSDGATDPVLAVAGQPTLLPCDTSPPRKGDTRQMVLIFKDGNTAPVYSWDTRPRSSSSSSSCSRCPGETLASRAYFWDLRDHDDTSRLNPLELFASNGFKRRNRANGNRRPTSKIYSSAKFVKPRQSGLSLNPVLASDTGDYLCRVDFKSSPTKNSFMQLKVLEPVSSIIIRGFLTSKETVTSTTARNNNSTSLLDLGLPLFAQKNINYPSDQQINNYRTVGSTHESKKNVVSDGQIWKSNISGRTVIPETHRTVGPFPVGQELLLQCEVTHGSPSPNVTWVEDGQVVLPSSVTQGDHRSSLGYRVLALSVEDIGRIITCVAENSHITPLALDTVRLEVAVPPSELHLFLDNEIAPKNVFHNMTGGSKITDKETINAHEVKVDGQVGDIILVESAIHGLDYIHPYAQKVFNSLERNPRNVLVDIDSQATSTDPVTTNNEDINMDPHTIELREGETRSLVCESRQSRPAAAVLWSMDDQLVPDHLIQTTHSTGTPSTLSNTRSTLRFVVSPSHHNAVIQCRASIANMPDHALMRQTTISVLYSPQVTLTSLSPLEDVIENSTVTLRCTVLANPSLTGRITFYRNDEVLHHTSGSGLTNTSSELVVRHTGPATSGYYTCSANNAMGMTTSAPLHVRVKYAPRCAQSVHASYSSRGGEMLTVSCSVHSHPRPTAFRWYILSSEEDSDDGSQLVDSSEHSDSGRSSTLQYQAPLHPPYPTLHCYADNDVGQMKEPCVITIVPAAQPGRVNSCSVRDMLPYIEGTVRIDCLPGKDGGLNQSFTLEVRPTTNPQARPPKALYFSSLPHFEVSGLLPREEYTLTVIATNARGLSPSYTITYTASAIERSPLSSFILPEDVTPLLAILIASTVLIMTCIGGALWIRCQFKKFHDKGKSSGNILIAPSTNAEYTRLHRYGYQSLMRDGEKTTLLRMCRVVGCVGGAACTAGSVDGSSFGGDSLSRGSCKSTTETVLWADASDDSDSQQTFRNSGCYHIDNLTPPECVATRISPTSSTDAYRGSGSLDRLSAQIRRFEQTTGGSNCSSCSQKLPSRLSQGEQHHSTGIYVNENDIKHIHTTLPNGFPGVERCRTGNEYHDYDLPDPDDYSLNHEINLSMLHPKVSYINPPHLDSDSDHEVSESMHPDSSSLSSRPSSGMSIATVTLNPNYVPVLTNEPTVTINEK